MAQSALDVARESIECFNAGDFDRPGPDARRRGSSALPGTAG